MTDYNFLVNNLQESGKEVLPLVANFIMKLSDEEGTLFGYDATGYTEQERNLQQARATHLAGQMEQAIFAVPKNEDGQTRGIITSLKWEPDNIAILYVNKPFRRESIARGLVERFIKDRPGREIGVRVLNSNAVALAFYKNLGFSFTEPVAANLEVKGVYHP